MHDWLTVLFKNATCVNQLILRNASTSYSTNDTEKCHRAVRAGCISREGKPGVGRSNMAGRSSNLTIRSQDTERQVQVRIRARDSGQGQTQPGDHPAWPPGRDRSELSQEARSESRSGMEEVHAQAQT